MSVFFKGENVTVVLLKNKSEDDDNKRWVEIVSWEPRAFLYHNFLTKEECEHLINIAKPSMHKSTVDDETGKSVDNSARTSSGTFINRGHDKILRNIEQRIADFTFIPVENGESVNILHYEVGQKYEPHPDFFTDEINTKNGGEQGGETVFPFAEGNFSSVPWWNELSDCGKKGLSIKPKMGDALLFWSMKPDGTLDPLSMHGACPVIKGDKWSCTKWMRVGKWSIPK
ncbi:prolyl 4-hydroxylase alpha subunit, putative [Medicago truncatula]|uniref:procollagen-proline 4-dioxygenase n=1 Tax=Medicago truncatula TaxID=3880 RepID=G7LB38_MEDTR|nr:prolyl 4-hydroxylase alpha subunit, putative [Medicago truncatula]